MYGKLKNKVVLVTGGNSGIGKAVVLAFAREGAKISFLYYGNEAGTETTLAAIESLGSEGIAFGGDVSQPAFCQQVIAATVAKYGALHILINNAGVQFPEGSITDMKEEHIRRTFEVNVLGALFMVQAALPFLHDGDCIINTTSSTAYVGHPQLIDYSATKGAIVSLTRSMALQLKEKNIRVNAVAPGAVVTPLTKKNIP